MRIFNINNNNVEEHTIFTGRWFKKTTKH